MQGASSSDHQKMAKDWEREEEKAKAAYTESVRQDLSSKRIELWKALLKASTLQDTDILEIVKRRADAADKPLSSLLFPLAWNPAITSPAEPLDG